MVLGIGQCAVLSVGVVGLFGCFNTFNEADDK